MPNDKFPLAAGKKLGFSTAQLEAGFLVREMGNTYSGSSPMGLAAVLDRAAAGGRILRVSYGSGSGSGGFVLRPTAAPAASRDRAPPPASPVPGHPGHLPHAQYA